MLVSMGLHVPIAFRILLISSIFFWSDLGSWWLACMAAACWLLCLCVGWWGWCVSMCGWAGVVWEGGGSWGVIVGRSYPPSLICPSFLLPNGLWPPGEGCLWLVSTPIPALLSGLVPLSAHVYCAHCFHVVRTISSCALLLCSSSYTLSPFSYCLAPLLRHLGLRFLLPLSTSTLTVCSPFASTQYLYCTGYNPVFPTLSTFTEY